MHYVKVFLRNYLHITFSFSQWMLDGINTIYLGHATATKCLINRFKSVILYGRR